MDFVRMTRNPIAMSEFSNFEFVLMPFSVIFIPVTAIARTAYTHALLFYLYSS